MGASKQVDSTTLVAALKGMRHVSRSIYILTNLKTKRSITYRFTKQTIGLYHMSIKTSKGWVFVGNWRMNHNKVFIPAMGNAKKDVFRYCKWVLNMYRWPSRYTHIKAEYVTPVQAAKRPPVQTTLC